MSIWQTLFWKELHEHKWKLLSLVVIVTSVLIAQLMADDLEAGLVLVTNGFVLAAPIFVGMGVGAGEQSNGAISFVRSLPIPTWQSGLVRVVVGWFVLIVPLLVALVLCEVALVLAPEEKFSGMRQSLGGRSAGVDSASDALLLIIGFSIAVSTFLYAWILFTTMNQKTELRAGLTGLLTVVLLIFCAISVDEYLDEISFGFAAVILAATGLLGWLAVRTYGESPLFDLPALKENAHDDHSANSPLQQPLASPDKALMWMQLRESAPIVLCGLVLTALIASINGSAIDAWAVGAFIGCILALVIGVGSFVPQLQPELHTFWRSRPISPSRWFWLKYLAGATVLVCCYDLPLAALHFIALHYHPNNVHLHGRGLTSVVYACFPIMLHLLVYSCVVLTSCGIRHAIYSALLGVAAVLLVLLAPEAIRVVPHQLSFIGLWQQANSYLWYDASWNAASSILQSVFNASLLLGPLVIGCALLAHWLIRKDISAAS